MQTIVVSEFNALEYGTRMCISPYLSSFNFLIVLLLPWQEDRAQEHFFRGAEKKRLVSLMRRR